MKMYKELELRKIREDCDLDFAHFTYLPDMCNCCYGPKDLPSLYWKNREIPKDDNYTYVLFGNAENGSGYVKRKDLIYNDYITYRFLNYEQKKQFVLALREKLGFEYIVTLPKSDTKLIYIKILSDKNVFKKLILEVLDLFFSNGNRKEYYVKRETLLSSLRYRIDDFYIRKEVINLLEILENSISKDFNPDLYFVRVFLMAEKLDINLSLRRYPGYTKEIVEMLKLKFLGQELFENL